MPTPPSPSRHAILVGQPWGTFESQQNIPNAAKAKVTQIDRFLSLDLFRYHGRIPDLDCQHRDNAVLSE
jgi:hypothetical protein